MTGESLSGAAGAVIALPQVYIGGFGPAVYFLLFTVYFGAAAYALHLLTKEGTGHEEQREPMRPALAFGGGEGQQQMLMNQQGVSASSMMNDRRERERSDAFLIFDDTKLKYALAFLNGCENGVLVAISTFIFLPYNKATFVVAVSGAKLLTPGVTALVGWKPTKHYFRRDGVVLAALAVFVLTFLYSLIQACLGTPIIRGVFGQIVIILCSLVGGACLALSKTLCITHIKLNHAAQLLPGEYDSVLHQKMESAGAYIQIGSFVASLVTLVIIISVTS